MIASLGARVWVSLMSFAFVPLYIRYLGIEGYGLIGLFTTLLAVFALLDLGLGLTVNREMARMGQDDGGRSRARSLLRTLEMVYGAVALLIGATLALAAPLIVKHWIHTRTITADEAMAAVRLMGATAMLRWPVALYLGALQGMRRQVISNAITAAGATLAGGGAVLVLWLLSPTVTAFFGWQVIAWGLQLVALHASAWRVLRLPGDRPGIDFSLLRSTAGFSAGVTGVTLLGISLSQLDKLVLTRVLPLGDFGHYALAFSIASVIPTIASAIETAVFPALASAIARGDDALERRLYHQASQVLALLLIPAGVTLALFAPELLTAYVRDPSAVARTHLQLSVMAAANLCLGAVVLPFSLQLAHGWTSLSITKNIVALALYAPLLLVLVGRLGTVGAAISWLALCGSYVLVEVPIMHRRLLRGEQWRWYLIDMGRPLAVTLLVLGVLRLVLPPNLPMFATLAVIAAGSALALLLSAVSLPAFRLALRRRVAAMRNGWRPALS